MEIFLFDICYFTFENHLIHYRCPLFNIWKVMGLSVILYKTWLCITSFILWANSGPFFLKLSVGPFSTIECGSPVISHRLMMRILVVIILKDPFQVMFPFILTWEIKPFLLLCYYYYWIWHWFLLAC